MTEADWRARAREIADDLTSIEVNTILRAHITGEKMPDPRHALFDIAEGFFAALRENLEDRGGFFDRLAGKLHTGGLDTFETLYDVAADALDPTRAPGGDPERPALTILGGAGERALIRRVAVHCAQIKQILRTASSNRKDAEALNNLTRNQINRTADGAPPEALKLTSKQLVVLRKIWEVGTEEIAIQTVVQLDGDVVTRMHPKFASEDHPAEALRALHGEGVSTAIRSWQFLVRTVTDFFKVLGKGLGLLR